MYNEKDLKFLQDRFNVKSDLSGIEHKQLTLTDILAVYNDARRHAFIDTFVAACIADYINENKEGALVKDYTVAAVIRQAKAAWDEYEKQLEV